MQLAIAVETTAAPLVVQSLVGSSGVGSKTELPGGATLQLQDPGLERRGADMTAVVLFVLSIPTGVATSLIAAWLYDRLGKGGPPRKLVIDRTEVRFDRGHIEEVIKERIESRR